MLGYTFRKGVIDGLPIGIGYLSVAFAFGIFAVGSGLHVFDAVLLSMTNLTSAGQFAAVPIMAAGGMLSELALAQLVINLRYALMSISLSQKLDKSVRLIDRFLIAFFNTDEIFAVASSQRDLVGRRYLYGLALTPFLGWSLGTLLGAVAGDVLPTIITDALGLAIYGMFFAILLPAARHRGSVAVCILLSAMLGCVFYYVPVLSTIPKGFVTILCAVVAAAVMALVAPIKTESEANGDD